MSSKPAPLKKSYRITPHLTLLCPFIPIAGYEYYVSPYLVHGDKLALVDCGPRAAVPALLEATKAAGFHPENVDYIILTHIHMDHAGGIGTLLTEMKHARVVAHSRAKSHLIDPAKLWKASLESVGDLAVKYGMIEPVAEEKIIVAEEGMKIDVGSGLELQILLTPGHAVHHLSAFETKERVLLAGDAAGSYRDNIPRLTIQSPFNFADYLASLDKMIALNPDKIAYAHYGCYDGALALLGAMRDKLLLWHDVVESDASAGKSTEEIVEIIRTKDRTLDYLDTLNQSGRQYQYDFARLVMSVKELKKSDR